MYPFLGENFFNKTIKTFSIENNKIRWMNIHNFSRDKIASF